MRKLFLLSFLALTGIANAQNWSLTGNSGISSGTNFLGTTDNQSLVFKTNNIEWIKLTTKGRLIFQNIDNGYGWNNNLFIAGGNDFATGLGNTSVGLGSLVSITTGLNNTAFGANSLKPNTTGEGNTAIGVNSLWNNTTGSNNTALGLNTLSGAGTLTENTAIGFASMARYNAIASNNIGYNTALGSSSLGGVITGNYNTALGRSSLTDLVSGSNNVAIGANSASGLSSGSNNIIIGYGASPTSSSVNNQLNIGNWIRGNNGTIGIGTSNLPSDGIAGDGEKYKLFVKDGIKTEKVKVEIAAANGWADYVFTKDYKLMPLKEVENYISINGHLPEVPSTEEAIQNGIELKEMNILLLKKIEELTLHLIKQDKRIEELEANNKK
ncbi:autotransporter outer membrane beta-barrel domain-containing protein [Epilithonimonas hungarica]|uniref:Peptidase S74 domain-containing protein n=1 Tax=Epilithonimonas hungarica TaxID=454006 RepID=A0A1G7MUC6_9FLAO|nr:hypothetical protein [Epilithonimonas hungarica]SDF65297.1 hypothetical protein SAMN05421825_1819 [Epilithonimonas hungarica]